MNLCKCGCGNYVKLNYKKGHGRKGKTNSVEHNLSISRANKGRRIGTSWNKGLKGKGVIHVSTLTKYKMSTVAKERGFGKWMEGRKFNDTIREKMSNTRKGHKVTEETKKKISFTNTGENNGMYGKHLSLEAKAMISNSSKKMWKDESFRNTFVAKCKQNNSYRKGALKTAIRLKEMGFSDTLPEIEMSKILNELNFNFIHPYPIENILHCYLADFYLDKYNLIIEVDGKFWHNYPDGREIDKIRNEELQKKGYKILRFWEGEFNKEIVTKEILEIS